MHDEETPSQHVRKIVADTVGHLTEAGRRFDVALDAPLTTLSSLGSSSRFGDSRPTPGARDPLLELHGRADVLVREAMRMLADLTPGDFMVPPPAPSPAGPAHRWVEAALDAARLVVDDRHDAWWTAEDRSPERASAVADLVVLERGARGLRNRLEWTLADEVVRPACRCGSCRRRFSSSDGDRRRVCGACRTAASRARKAS